MTDKTKEKIFNVFFAVFFTALAIFIIALLYWALTPRYKKEFTGPKNVSILSSTRKSRVIRTVIKDHITKRCYVRYWFSSEKGTMHSHAPTNLLQIPCPNARSKESFNKDETKR